MAPGDEIFSFIAFREFRDYLSKEKNFFPDAHKGRKKSYNSCETEEGKTRPSVPRRGPGGAPPRDRLELSQGGPGGGKENFLFCQFIVYGRREILPRQREEIFYYEGQTEYNFNRNG
jgi:hypothetical protein